jgi:transcriptional regulator with XRE-family HTH domain
MKFEKFEKLKQELPEEVKKRAKKRAKEISYALSLAEIREQQGITQVDLAKRLKINQSAVSRLEKREGISLSKLHELIEAMGGKLEINIKFNNRKFKLNPEFS